MHINSISCGQGAPSLYLIVMAGEQLFPCDVVIVADTGWERDMLWSTGERTDAQEFFNRVTYPLAKRYGIDAVFVRTRDKNGIEYLDLDKAQGRAALKNPERSILDIPLFGSNGGKLKQSCTDKWKIRAIRQELRRRGADTATTALGLTLDETDRMKKSGVNWVLQSWPLLDYAEVGHPGKIETMGINRRLYRDDIVVELDKRKIPYMVTSECDGCPHKNWARWQRTSPATIAKLAKFEQQFDGLYLTRECVPLPEAIARMRDNHPDESLFDSGDCADGGYCFV